MQVSGTGEVSDARVLAGALEPFAAQVYFAPEAHSGYAELGFSGSRRETEGVAMPDGPAYFCSRGALLGQVPGQVVAAAFGVFNPAVVIPAVGYGWSLTTAEAICAVRDEAGVAQLRRILGDHPPEVAQLAKVLGRPKSYVRSRAWTDGALDDGLARLERRGLIGGDRLTVQGRHEREAIEVRTDEQCSPILEGLGAHLADTVDNLRRLSDAVRAAGGYPAAGPHDLAAASA